MQRKQVIFVADSLDNAHKFQQVLSSLDVDVAAGSSAQFKKLLTALLSLPVPLILCPGRSRYSSRQHHN